MTTPRIVRTFQSRFAQLATVGCKIGQAEAFYIEPKEQPSDKAA